MDRYIGLDAHLQSCTFAVMGPSGKRLKSAVVETNGSALVEFVRLVPGHRHLCTEEGTQSQWLYEILSQHCHEMLVMMPEANKGQKDDYRDAWDLADRIRTGRVGRTVFKKTANFTTLREITRSYGMVTEDVVRTKNRLKSLYRSRGVSCRGCGLYQKDNRDRWLKQLPSSMRKASSHLYAELDSLVEIKKRAQKEMLAEAIKHPIAKVLQTAPGLGEVRVAQVLSIVVTPHRFRTNRQFWAYCGLAIVERSSSDWVPYNGRWVRAEVRQTRGLNQNRNGTLKMIFKQAATTVISQPSEPLYEDYQRLLQAGTRPNLAKLTIARKIAAITLAMWRKKEKYDPKKYRGKTQK